MVTLLPQHKQSLYQFLVSSGSLLLSSCPPSANKSIISAEVHYCNEISCTSITHFHFISSCIIWSRLLEFSFWIGSFWMC